MINTWKYHRSIFVVRYSAVLLYYSVTANPNVHGPVMDYLVLALQCGKISAVVLTYKHRDNVADVLTCCCSLLDLLFLILSVANDCSEL